MSIKTTLLVVLAVILMFFTYLGYSDRVTELRSFTSGSNSTIDLDYLYYNRSN